MPPSRRQASLSQLGEFQLIQSISRGFSRGGIRPTVGIGDDAAVLELPSPTQIVISTDLMIEHIHFNRTTSTFYDIGYKAAAVNLSDIAAMGATPTSILVAIALPPHLNHQDWKELYRGLAVPCKAQKVQLIGGDTSSSPSVLFIAITILGRIKPGQSLTRSGAKAGDIIYVSGTLGDSAAGLEYLHHQKHPVKVSTLLQPIKFLVRRHLQPTPRIGLGQMLSTHGFASAALDLSDGLSGDLTHLCRQSRVGALIHHSHIPLSTHMVTYAAQKNMPPLTWALHGGEDYELLFTVPPTYRRRLEQAVKTLRLPITAIGVVQPRRVGIRIEDSDGSIHPLLPRSYEHFST